MSAYMRKTASKALRASCVRRSRFSANARSSKIAALFGRSSNAAFRSSSASASRPS